MYEENRFEYTVRACSADDAQELEDLLNDMAGEGWELYSLNETESDEGEYQHLCIFSREIHGAYGHEDEYMIDAGDFKTTMKRLLNKKDDLYKECRYLQQEIREKNKQLKGVKDSLDADEGIDRESLNREISDKMGELNSLKGKFSDLLSPSGMYNRISQDLLTIVVSYELASLIDSEKDGDLIAESVKLRQKLTDKLGYVIPRVNFTMSDEMNENEYAINVRSLKTLTGLVYSGFRRFFIGQSNIENIPEDAIEDDDPVSGQKIFWLDETKTKDFWDKGLTPSQVIISHLECVVLRYVDEILSYRDILNYISLLEEGNTFLAEELLQKNISIGDLRYIFASLIREKVSVKDIVYIFEKLNDVSKNEKNRDKLLEDLRYALRRQICMSIADENNVICAIAMPKKYKKEELVKYVTDIHQKTQANVLVSDTNNRKELFNLFENIIPELRVISEDEVTEEFTLEEC